jgi:hypothetical protein
MGVLQECLLRVFHISQECLARLLCRERLTTVAKPIPITCQLFIHDVRWSGHFFASRTACTLSLCCTFGFVGSISFWAVYHLAVGRLSQNSFVDDFMRRSARFEMPLEDKHITRPALSGQAVPSEKSTRCISQVPWSSAVIFDQNVTVQALKTLEELLLQSPSVTELAQVCWIVPCLLNSYFNSIIGAQHFCVPHSLRLQVCWGKKIALDCFPSSLVPGSVS